MRSSIPRGPSGPEGEESSSLRRAPRGARLPTGPCRAPPVGKPNRGQRRARAQKGSVATLRSTQVLSQSGKTRSEVGF